jgi:predicted phosphodiesterase
VKPNAAGRRARNKIVEGLLERFPDASNAVLARKLAKSHPQLFVNDESARNALRYVQGAQGDRSRKNGKTARLRHPGRSHELPESLAKPFPATAIDASRVLVLADIHCPFQSNEALELALDYGRKFKPDCILLNGDFLDFHGISFFARDPRGPGVKEELAALEQVFSCLRHRFPKARIVAREGNHEERWRKLLWQKAPEILDIAEFSWQHVAGFAEHKVEIITGQRQVMLGLLPVLHGHELPRGLSSPVNPARGAFLRTLTSVMHSHGHRTSEHTEPTMDGRVITCRTTGCLCGLSPDWQPVSKWDHGFATVEVADDGSYEAELKRIIRGKVV